MRPSSVTQRYNTYCNTKIRSLVIVIALALFRREGFPIADMTPFCHSFSVTELKVSSQGKMLPVCTVIYSAFKNSRDLAICVLCELEKKLFCDCLHKLVMIINCLSSSKQQLDINWAGLFIACIYAPAIMLI